MNSRLRLRVVGGRLSARTAGIGAPSRKHGPKVALATPSHCDAIRRDILAICTHQSTTDDFEVRRPNPRSRWAEPKSDERTRDHAGQTRNRTNELSCPSGAPAPHENGWVHGFFCRAQFSEERATRGYHGNCVAPRKGGDDTCCSASSLLPRRASPVTGGCEALGTTYPHPSGWRRKREPTSRLPAPRWSGTRRAW
jgi:hypothetical protein